MSDSSTLFETLLGSLRQPTWIAAIASVGIHGLLGASTPVLNIFPRPTPNQSPVKLVQLNPGQLGNLPSSRIPPIPPKGNFSPIPAPPLSLPPLPPEPASVALPTLPPPLEATLPPWPPISANPQPVVPPNRPQTPTTPRSSPTPRRPSSPINTPPPSDPSPEDSGTNLPAPRVPERDPGLEGGAQSDRTGLPFLGDGNQDGAINPNPPDGQGGSDLGLNPNPADLPPNSSSQQIVAAHENYVQRYREMLARFKSSYPDLEEGRLFRDSGNYPEGTCSRNPQTTRKAVIGVVVKPNGKLRAIPEVLVTTGDIPLDRLAQEIASRQSFEPASQHKLYPVDVTFTCSAVPPISPTPTPTPPALESPPPSPTPTPTTSPSPNISPQPSPKPSPTTSPQPTPTTSPTVSPQPTPTASPTASPEPTPTASPTASPEPTPTTSPTASPEPTPTTSPTASPQPTPTTSPTASPEPTPTTSPTASPEPTPTTSPAASETPASGQ